MQKSTWFKNLDLNLTCLHNRPTAGLVLHFRAPWLVNSTTLQQIHNACVQQAETQTNQPMSNGHIEVVTAIQLDLDCMSIRPAMHFGTVHEVGPPWPQCSISPKSQSRTARSDLCEAPRCWWAPARCSAGDRSESPAPPGHWRFPRPLPRSKLPPWGAELGPEDARKGSGGCWRVRQHWQRPHKEVSSWVITLS